MEETELTSQQQTVISYYADNCLLFTLQFLLLYLSFLEVMKGCISTGSFICENILSAQPF